MRAHPQVERLDAGPFGTIASHLPGRRRVLGVRVVVETGRVELAVVARLGLPLPQLAAELAAAVGPLVPGADVDVTVTDVVPGLVPVPDPPRSPPGPVAVDPGPPPRPLRRRSRRGGPAMPPGPAPTR